MEKSDLRAEVRMGILSEISRLNQRGVRQLPAEKILADQLQVSRSTLRTVLSEMEAEGKVFRRHGSGTYINAHAFNKDTTLYPQVYHGEIIRRSGYTPSIEIMDVRELPGSNVDESVRRELKLDLEAKLISASKMYKGDGRPCIFCVDYLSQSILPPEHIGALQNEAISIFQFLTLYTDIKIAWDMVKLEAIDSGQIPDVAAHWGLGEEFKSFLLISTVNFDERNRPIIYSRSYIDTNMIQYHLMRHNFEEETRE